MELILIAAVARNRVIGVNNQLPWHLPEDLRHFRELTRGQAVIMGRKTWESLPEAFRPLPGRRNIVLTRQPGLSSDPRFAGAEIQPSLEQARATLGDHGVQQAFVIGGVEIYQQAIALADRLEITEVDMSPAGDAWFPEIDPATWVIVAQRAGNPTGAHGFSFVTYRRRPTP